VLGVRWIGKDSQETIVVHARPVPEETKVGKVKPAEARRINWCDSPVRGAARLPLWNVYW